MHRIAGLYLQTLDIIIITFCGTVRGIQNDLFGGHHAQSDKQINLAVTHQKAARRIQ
jgi:hypothetical protein